jgi:hypothetical protein
MRLFLPSVAVAQVTAPSPAGVAEVERVIVTGSNIPTAEETGPVLSERLVTNFYTHDKELLDFSRARADKQMPKLMGAASANYTLLTISDAPNGCIDDTWTATSTTNAPSARQSHAAVWTCSEMDGP